MTSAAFRADRYNRGAIWFHWTIAALVIVNLIIGLFHESLLDGLHLMPIHMAIGITVLVLSIARLAWRLVHPAPPLPTHMPGWEKGLSKTVQAVFYFLIIAMPLTGWAMVSGPPHPHAVSWFGLFTIPPLPVAKPLAGFSHEFHEIAGYIFTGLALLHIAGALRHHFLLRDSVLGRMNPARSAPAE